MREIGQKIRLMDMENTFVLMAPVMKDTGRRINDTERVWRNGQMAPSMTVNIKPEKRAAMATCYGEMAAHTEEISSKTICMALGYTHGQIIDATQVNGKTIKCMATVNSCGPMADLL